jgi:hypothetical protein
MAISESVDNYLDDARGAIRSALALAAHNERPSVITNLSQILQLIDSVKSTEEVADTMENFVSKIKKGLNGPDPMQFRF